MASKVSISMTARNTNNETVTTNISNVNPRLFASTDTAILAAAYEFVDTAMRTLNNLTNNTYVDSVVTFSESVNEQIAD